MKHFKLLITFSVLFCLSVPLSKAYSGNKELLQKWAHKKEQIVKTVLEKLRKEGKLPENGTIKFTAKVKPVDTESLDVKFESLEVIPKSDSDKPGESQSESANTGSSKAQKTQNQKEMEEIFRPRNPEPIYTKGEIKIKGGKVEEKQVEVLDSFVGGGKTDEFDEHHSDSTHKDVRPSWWQRFLRRMKIK